MKYPDFFKSIPTITMQDPLAELLGAFDDGIITYSYLDAVKLAGHSCPTVAGAYLMTFHALHALYKDEIPKRGQIIITCKASRDEGVNGVIENVMSLITGASEKEGFKGLQGNYARNNLLRFDEEQRDVFVFKRADNNKQVSVTYNPSVIQTLPILPELMQKVIRSVATQEEYKEFARVWQGNVQAILESFNEPNLILVKELN